ncbi:MAG TPA: ABC transporter ATP-binding protein, partial [Dissulfurispiraceae bacterium]|nr:ABC transporter ATP-binding protein [Dissulfurispiraceae bacterium]
MNIVSARGLTKDYNSLRAVESLDFDIARGECFGFLGPNGAGKTTVMRIIYCFLPPTSGAVRVFDMDVVERPSQIKARIGVMPQDDNLDPDLNVIENLVVYARYFDIPKESALHAAGELLEFVGLTGKARAPIRSLSGGMKRGLL